MRSLPTLIMYGAGLVLLALAADRRRAVRAPRLPTAPPTADGPLVSILIPARNEEHTIARCVRGALQQRYAHTEVLVLDDESTDATGPILADLSRDGRLTPLAGTPLPVGWVGKCHACRQLAAAAHGEWLLFLDADTAPGPDLAAALVAHAESQQLDLLSVLPHLELESLGERLVLPAFFALLAGLYPLERMEHPDARPDEVFAGGWCVLVRRAAYEAIGGHGAVRGEVLEDVRLAQTLRRAGYRIGGADGSAHLRLRMYRNTAEVAAGLGKNAAAGYQSGGVRSVLVIGRLLGEAFGPVWLAILALFVRGAGARRAQAAAWLGLGLTLAHWASVYRTRYGLSRRHAPLWPLGLLAYLIIAANGMRQVWSGRGVVWKGRRYQ